MTAEMPRSLLPFHALVLGAGLLLAEAAPSAHVAPMTNGNEGIESDALFAAVPADAFALFYLANPVAFRERAQRNDWVKQYDALEGGSALVAWEKELESMAGIHMDGLFELVLQLHGQTLLFLTGDAAGFLTETPPDRAALRAAMMNWMAESPRESVELTEGVVHLGGWPAKPQGDWKRGDVLAFLDHPRAMGLFSAQNSDAAMETITACLAGMGGEPKAPVVQKFFEAGGRTTPGVEAFIDFSPFVRDAEQSLKAMLEEILVDPTGLLGLEKGTHLFVSADISPGVRIELDGHLTIPSGTVAAQLADTFEPLPAKLAADFPEGTWTAGALMWDMNGFYETLREAIEDAKGDLGFVDQSLATAEAMTGADPIDDIIGPLTGLFATYNVLKKGELQFPIEQGFAFLMGLSDSQGFEDLFNDLIGSDEGIEATEIHGAKTYLLPEHLLPGSGGIAFLPQTFFVAPYRDTLDRGLGALARIEGAGLAQTSPLQGAFDENAGATGFGYVELLQLQRLALLRSTPEAADDPGENLELLDSQLIFAARRVPQGFNLRIYTR